MIDRVVQRPFLFWQAEAMVAEPPAWPENPLPDELATEPPPTAVEIKAAQRAVAEALTVERRIPLSLSDSEGVPPVELRAYFPRNPALSIVQSAVEQYLMEFSPAGQLTAIDDAEDSFRDDADVVIADYVLQVTDEDIPPEEDDERRLAGAMEFTDPRWVSSLVAMGWRKLAKRKPFPPRPAQPHSLADDARIVVVGDWASGNRSCRRVAKEMRTYIDDAISEGRECHIVHLGDTYYAGWGREYRENFLAHWPVELAEAGIVRSWSLAGNHDMQTGGHGYYTVLLDDPRFKPYQAGSSWFSLENSHWQLLGLDTAWQDHAIGRLQQDWVEGKVGDHPKRRTMLLSHHQPFSAYNDGGCALKAELQRPIGEGRIDAWLWGHEHRCAIYAPHEIHAPRLIGHGGVPARPPAHKPPGVVWHLDRSYSSTFESWAFRGFAVLDFADRSVAVAYVNEFGETDEQETI